MTSLSHSQSNSHHRCRLLEPLHGAGCGTVPSPDTTPMGAGVCSVELQPQFHGVAAAVRWSTLGILRAYVRFLTSCELVLDRPEILPHRPVRARGERYLYDITELTPWAYLVWRGLSSAPTSLKILSRLGRAQSRLIGSDSSQVVKAFPTGHQKARNLHNSHV